MTSTGRIRLGEIVVPQGHDRAGVPKPNRGVQRMPLAGQRVAGRKGTPERTRPERIAEEALGSDRNGTSEGDTVQRPAPRSHPQQIVRPDACYGLDSLR